MKPRVILLLVVLLAVMLLVARASEQDRVEVGFSSESIHAYLNDTLEVSVVIDPHGNPVQSGEIIVGYDSDGLRVLDISVGGFWGPAPLVVKKEYNETTIVIVAAKPGEPASRPGEAVKIKFQVVAEAGTYSIRLVRVGLADNNGADLPVEVKTGECKVVVLEVVKTENATITPEATASETMPATQTTTTIITETATIAHTTRTTQSHTLSQPTTPIRAREAETPRETEVATIGFPSEEHTPGKPLTTNTASETQREQKASRTREEATTLTSIGESTSAASEEKHAFPESMNLTITIVIAVMGIIALLLIMRRRATG